jgi:hypothetical protein
VVRTVDADYLVVGAGAAGLAFTDALVDHDPDVHVALVDRRDGVGGHWRAAYSFVRLHQASQFDGVASTVFGGGVQRSGPEADAITWVRPRDPWMLNRAVVQPDPAVFLGMAATVMQRSSEAVSLPGLFLELESAGVMLRLDRSVEPTMAKTPTLATWELDLLRSVERVVRLGRILSVEPGRIHLAGGTVDVAADAVIVNCAADGLRNPARVPIWGGEAITLQPIRAGFPCFGAALAGYVEATRDDDAVKNALCAPSSYGNSLEEWAVMNVLGSRNVAAFSAEPDIATWVSTVAINPARVPPDHPGSPALDAALEDLANFGARGVTRLAELAGLG